MNHSKSVILLAAALLGASISASAGTVGAFEISLAPGPANTAVAAVSDKVTYAKTDEALKTFVAFNVGSGAYLLKNKSRNTLNNITVEFSASVTDATEKLKLFDAATYLAGLTAAGCSIPPGEGNPLVITCQVSQLKTGNTFLPPFTVFYEAPFKVTQNPPSADDATGGDKVKLDIRIVYAEGTNGKNPINNSVDIKDGTAAVLGTDNPTFVKSALPKLNGAYSIFTGNKGLPNGSDMHATEVRLPFTSVNFSTVLIEETPDLPDNSACIQVGFFKTCHTTLLLAPDASFIDGNFLTETIRVVKDNLVMGAASKADTLIWWYTPTNSVGQPTGAATPIGLCASPTTPPTGEGPTVPCQTKPGICYKSSDAPTPDLVDICVWEFINRNNGRTNPYQ